METHLPPESVSINNIPHLLLLENFGPGREAVPIPVEVIWIKGGTCRIRYACEVVITNGWREKDKVTDLQRGRYYERQLPVNSEDWRVPAQRRYRPPRKITI